MSYEERIMSKDKYPSIFSPQMEAIVFIILQILFRNARSFENWGIFSDIPLGNIRSRDVLRPIARQRKYLMVYNGSYTMMAESMKTLALYYPMIQFLINKYINFHMHIWNSH